eukprot:4782381-Prymnesium_polylepis.3
MACLIPGSSVGTRAVHGFSVMCDCWRGFNTRGDITRLHILPRRMTRPTDPKLSHRADNAFDAIERLV